MMRASAVLRGVLISAALAWAIPLQTLASAELFVAPNGNDENPGTLERPLASPKAARDAIRAMKRAGGLPSGGVTVFLRGGTYDLPVALHLRPEDSGAADKPVVYAGYQDEIPVLSGGKRVLGVWQPHRDGIMKLDLRRNPQNPLDFTQLFVNGKRQIRARFPNYDAGNPLVKGNGYINAVRSGRDDFHYDPATFSTKRWARPQEAVVHVFPQHYWGNLQFEVRDVNRGENGVKLGRGGFQIARESPLSGASRFFIENIFEELDAPGEWYLNKSEGVLYCLPPPGVDLAKATVEAPVLKQVVEFLGSESQPVHHIALRGLKIAHTASVFLDPYDVPSKGDWALSRSGSLYLEGAEDCAIENCFFDAVGGNAVFVNNYAHGIRVAGNKFTGAGESAVCLVGAKDAALGGGNNAYPRDNLVSNNLIHDCGIFGKQTAGVFLSITRKNTVSHNLIYNMPRAAICINDGTWGGHVIEHNDVHDTVRETSDHGPFNAWGRDRYEKRTVRPNDRAATIIRHNRFVEPAGSSWGIDLDDGSSDYEIRDNLCVGVSVKLRDGDRRTVENNIFVSPRPPAFHMIPKNNSDRFVRNIVATRDHDTVYRFIAQEGWLKEMNHNLLFNDVGKAVVKEGWGGEKAYTLDDWKKTGNDVNSLLADPQFVDAARGDYRVKDSSPALKLGFRNFAMDQFGLTEEFPKRWRE